MRQLVRIFQFKELSFSALFFAALHADRCTKQPPRPMTQCSSFFSSLGSESWILLPLHSNSCSGNEVLVRNKVR